MFAASKTASVTGGYQISRSLRFNSADSAYLNRTPASAGNRKTWTLSAWVKRGSISTNQYFLSNLDTGGASGLGVQFPSDGTLHIFDYGASNYVYELQTTAVFRDPSAWYHFVITFDTTQATSSNRVKLYVNNVQQTAFSIASYPTLNYDGYWNNTSLSTISRAGGLSTQYFDGYVTETNFIDGQALTPSSFGQTDAQTGVWSPIAYSGSYGTNGFYLNFSDNSNTTAATLGKDYSGNGNNWTPNNFSVTAGAGNDSLVDSPTSYGTDTGVGGTVRGNYCTINPLDGTSVSATSNGNLDFTVSANGGVALGTMAVSSGKWYWEVVGTGGDASYMVGVANASAATSTKGWLGANGWFYYNNNGNKYNNSSSSSYGAIWSTGDVIGIALDMDAGSVTFYKNGTSQGTAYSSYSGLTMQPAVSSAGTNLYTINLGQRPFAYTAPSGFKALCTQNLPTPTIGATTATQASQFFTPVLYTGNGYPTAGTQSITTVGFQPDWVWIKNRSAAASHTLTDAVRGVNSQLFSNQTAAQEANTDDVTAFTSTGFNLGSGTTGVYPNVNTNSATYVAWNWKANGSGSSNTAGSITSTVSASTTSGFSVVTYTGNNAASATIGHGLGVAPSMIIGKARNNTYAWRVYHTSIGAANFLVLNATDASASGATWNSTTPTSTVFTVGGGSNMNVDSSTTYVAYCFAEVAGYSKFGSYAGNSSTDGPFVYCGFRPRYLMIKNITDSAGGYSGWYIIDTAREPYNISSGTVPDLWASNSGVEGSRGNGSGTDTFNYVDILSNGFKSKSVGSPSETNQSGNSYIFAAFAEVPFKYALAR